MNTRMRTPDIFKCLWLRSSCCALLKSTCIPCQPSHASSPFDAINFVRVLTQAASTRGARARLGSWATATAGRSRDRAMCKASTGTLYRSEAMARAVRRDRQFPPRPARVDTTLCACANRLALATPYAACLCFVFSHPLDDETTRPLTFPSTVPVICSLVSLCSRKSARTHTFNLALRNLVS
eukprot:2917288-Pleurochrysis_carterae.AAC.1